MKKTGKTQQNSVKSIHSITVWGWIALICALFVLVLSAFTNDSYVVYGTEGDGASVEASSTNDSGAESTDDAGASDSGSSSESATPGNDGEQSATVDNSATAESSATDGGAATAESTSEANTTSSADSTASAGNETKYPDAEQTKTPNATSSAAAMEQQTASALPSDMPTSTATVKITPKPTLSWIEAPIVSNGQILDIEESKDNNPTESHDPSGNNGTQDGQGTMGQNGPSNSVDYGTGTWSSFFNVLKYVFLVCAIISGAYTLYIVITTIIIKKGKSGKKS